MGAREPFDFELPPAEAALEPASEPASEPEPEAMPTAAPMTRRRRRRGLYVRLAPDGSVVWDALDPAAAEKLKRAAASASERRAPAVTFTPEECAFLYSILGELEAGLAASIGKCPRDLARKVWGYSAEDLAALAEPTSKVLSKHGGAFLERWREELVLVLALASVHQRKLVQWQSILAEHRKADRERNTEAPVVELPRAAPVDRMVI
jgi:hypothetical protein